LTKTTFLSTQNVAKTYSKFTRPDCNPSGTWHLAAPPAENSPPKVRQMAAVRVFRPVAAQAGFAPAYSPDWLAGEIS
jgi:hypothetical protein